MPVGLASVEDLSALSKQPRYGRGMAYAAFAVAAILAFAACGAEAGEPGSTGTPIVTPRATPALTPTGETPPVQGKVPQKILEPILKEAAALANVAREQLVIVRAEPVVWNDGSLGCPEPGMGYTQALVNGYWVVIKGAGQTFDFRVGSGGSFRLCPAGRGRPPLRSDAR
jgi:hypothetical protein